MGKIGFDTRRTCLFCGAQYRTKRISDINAFCSNCFTPERKREIKIVKNNLLRAQKVNLSATLTVKEWLKILEHFKWRCVYCKGEYQVMEHILSINAGGGTTALNCIPCCIGCNGAKDRVKRPHLNPLSAKKIEHAQEQLVILFAE